MNQQLVTVIIPTHNRANLLKRAVESVLKQHHSNLEIIIVADHCTDNTREVVHKFNDKRIQFVPLRKNVGGGQARNIAIERANGEYIAFLDDDDEWFEGKITEQINVFENYCDVALVSTNYVTFSGDKDVPQNNPKIIQLEDLFYKNYCGSFSFCMTRSDFVKDLRINPLLKASQDWDLWIKILITSNLRCRTIQDYLVRYYEHSNHRLTKKYDETLKSFIIILRQNWGYLNEKQKMFQLYQVSLRTNYCLDSDLFYKIGLSKKAFFYLIKSKYKFNFYELLRILGCIFTIRRSFFDKIKLLFK